MQNNVKNPSTNRRVNLLTAPPRQRQRQRQRHRHRPRTVGVKLEFKPPIRIPNLSLFPTRSRDWPRMCGPFFTSQRTNLLPNFLDCPRCNFLKTKGERAGLYTLDSSRTRGVSRRQAQGRKIGARSTPPSNIKACVAAPWLYFLLNYFSVLYSTFCP